MRTRRLFHAAIAAVVLAALPVVPATASSDAAHAVAATAVTSSAQCGGKNASILSHSASTGYGSTGYPEGAIGYHATKHGWTAQLARKYNDTTWHNPSINGGLVDDYAPGGRQERTVKAVSHIAKTKPGLVVIFLDGNEFMTSELPAVYGTKLAALAARVKAASPLTTLAFINVWDVPRVNDSNGPKLDEYRSFTKSVALAFGGKYIDLSDHMPPTWKDDHRDLYIDNEFGKGKSIHTTDNGHDLVYQIVSKRLPC